MSRKHGPSSITRFLQRNPAWSQVICVVGVALLIILGPIFLYGLLFHAGADTVRMLFSIPWWPVVLLVALVALLSLLHGNTGVSVEKRSGKKKDARAKGDPMDPSGPSDSPESSDSSDWLDPPGSPDSLDTSGPPDPSGPPGPPGKGSDPVRCTMHERTLSGLRGVDSNP